MKKISELQKTQNLYEKIRAEIADIQVQLESLNSDIYFLYGLVTKQIKEKK